MSEGKIKDIVFDVDPNPVRDAQGKSLGLHYGTITMTVVVRIGLHVHSCERCGADAPLPATEQLVELGPSWIAQHEGRYFSASGGRRDEPIDVDGNYTPVGWGRVSGKMLCGTCKAKVKKAIAEAMKP